MRDYWGEADRCACSEFKDGPEPEPRTRREHIARLVEDYADDKHWRDMAGWRSKKCGQYVYGKSKVKPWDDGLCAPCARPANHVGACIPDLNAARRWATFERNEYQAYYLLAPTSPSIEPYGSSTRSRTWQKADRRTRRANRNLVKRVVNDPRAWQRLVEARGPSYMDGARLREAVRERWRRKPWTRNLGHW